MSKVNDLTGQTFGKLTVLERHGSNKHGRTIWKCECSCADHTIVYATGNSLLRGQVKSCGCLNTENGLNRIEDLTGQIFGRLKVLKMADHKPGERVKWVCECLNDGNIVEVTGHNLKNGTTQSCGCLHEEVFNKIITKHGMVNHPLYGVWCGIKSRCNNPNSESYKDYGGRGITICKEWNDSFETFYNDVIDGYEQGLQIDRIDNNKGYCKENVRWTTPKQNCRNTRRNNLLDTPFGNITIPELAEKLKAPEGLVRSMIGNGHSVNDVIKRFQDGDIQYKKRKRIKYETPYGNITLSELARYLNVYHSSVINWHNKGMSIDEIIEKSKQVVDRRKLKDGIQEASCKQN